MPGLLGRQQAVARVLVLDGRGELTTEHVRLVAASVGFRSGRCGGGLRSLAGKDVLARESGSGSPSRLGLHARLVSWCGNAAVVHRELVAGQAAAVAEGCKASPVPSPATLYRAIRRDLNAGQRAALAGGERARRRHDVHLRRPRPWRNACWEADHTRVPVEVLLDGELVCPWVTWFVGCATNAVAGAACTPHQPSRDAILAALRISLSRDEDVTVPYGPVGGLPSLVRIDRGSGFLSRTVAAAPGAFAVPVEDLPACRPELKGTVEDLNRCAERVFFVSLPGCTHAPSAQLGPGSSRTRSAKADGRELLEFTVFVDLLLEWVVWWNTEDTSQALAGRAAFQVWQDDPIRSMTWPLTCCGRSRWRTTDGCAR